MFQKYIFLKCQEMSNKESKNKLLYSKVPCRCSSYSYGKPSMKCSVPPQARRVASTHLQLSVCLNLFIVCLFISNI